MYYVTVRSRVYQYCTVDAAWMFASEKTNPLCGLQCCVTLSLVVARKNQALSSKQKREKSINGRPSPPPLSVYNSRQHSILPIPPLSSLTYTSWQHLLLSSFSLLCLLPTSFLLYLVIKLRERQGDGSKRSLLSCFSERHGIKYSMI